MDACLLALKILMEPHHAPIHVLEFLSQRQRDDEWERKINQLRSELLDEKKASSAKPERGTRQRSSRQTALVPAPFDPSCGHRLAVQRIELSSAALVPLLLERPACIGDVVLGVLQSNTRIRIPIGYAGLDYVHIETDAKTSVLDFGDSVARWDSPKGAPPLGTQFPFPSAPFTGIREGVVTIAREAQNLAFTVASRRRVTTVTQPRLYLSQHAMLHVQFSDDSRKVFREVVLLRLTTCGD